MTLDFVSVVRPSLWFGAYPTQAQINTLEQHGVRAFINLTCTDELLEPYHTNYFSMNMPIEDNNIPDDIPLFCRQVSEVAKLVASNTLTFVHCRGGHGRSGMVAAIVTALVDCMSPDQAIACVTEAHKARPNIREFWKKRPCPHLHVQRKFIHRLFTPIYWEPKTPFALNKGFCTSSPHEVTINDVTYPTCEAAIHSMPSNYNYLSALYNSMLFKYMQHPDLLKSLMWTGFRPFVCKCEMPTCSESSKPVECKDGCKFKSTSDTLFAVKMKLLELV